MSKNTPGIDLFFLNEAEVLKLNQKESKGIKFGQENVKFFNKNRTVTGKEVESEGEDEGERRGETREERRDNRSHSPFKSRGNQGGNKSEFKNSSYNKPSFNTNNQYKSNQGNQGNRAIQGNKRDQGNRGNSSSQFKNSENNQPTKYTLSLKSTDPFKKSVKKVNESNGGNIDEI